MELNIENFRAIEKKKIKFVNQIYLFKGPSGSGKSSCIEAIKWCLYGRGRNVAPLNTKAKPCVTIITDDLKIVRSKNPEQLDVWNLKSNKKYQKSEAQNIIDQNFLSYENWELSSYLGQTCRNKLMYSNQSEKMELLKELIFGVQRQISEKYLQKINKNIKKYEKDFDKNSGALDFAIQDLNKVKKEKTDLIVQYKLAQKKSNQKKIANLEKLKDAEKLLEDRIISNQFQTKLNDLIEEKKEKLTEIKQKINDQYPKDFNYSFFKNWSETIQLQKDYKELNLDQDNYLSTDFKVDSLEQLIEIRPLSVKCDDIKQKYTDIGDIDKYLNELIDKHQKYINNHSKKEKFEKLIKVKKYQIALEKLQPSIEEKWKLLLNRFEIEDKDFHNEQHLEEIRKIVFNEQDIYNCPHCEQEVIMEGNVLKINKIEINDNDKESFNKIEGFLKKQKLISTKMEECKDAEDFEEYEDIDLDDVENQINELRYYDESVPSSHVISTLITLYKKRERKEIILVKLSKLNSEQFEGLEYPSAKEIDTYYSTFQTLKVKETEYTKFLEENEFEEINNDIEKDKEMSSEVREKIAGIEKLVSAIDEYKIIENKEKEIDKLEKKRKNIIEQSETNKKMEKIVKETESEVMNNNIDTINLQLNNILTALFEDIQIELSMIKNLKNGEARVSVNLKIILSGREYNNIEYLSGGELDRISMALTITFNLIMGSKIMLLDEVMSSLDGENREKCLQIMRRHLKNKIILNVCHETTEGYYDQIVQF
jgi:DNA repair exonuclease SbcCD ATPase subunit